MLRLRTINRWLRWSGFCLAVEVVDGLPTMLGIYWVGWRSTAKELSV